MIAWLTGTTVGKFIVTFFISMVPVVELRLGLPYGIALGLPYFTALTAAILGNMLPVPFIIIYIKRIFAWLRRHWAALDGFITRLERSHDSFSLRLFCHFFCRRHVCYHGVCHSS